MGGGGGGDAAWRVIDADMMMAHDDEMSKQYLDTATFEVPIPVFSIVILSSAGSAKVFNSSCFELVVDSFECAQQRAEAALCSSKQQQAAGRFK